MQVHTKADVRCPASKPCAREGDSRMKRLAYASVGKYASKVVVPAHGVRQPVIECRRRRCPPWWWPLRDGGFKAALRARVRARRVTCVGAFCQGE